LVGSAATLYKGRRPPSRAIPSSPFTSSPFNHQIRRHGHTSISLAQCHQFPKPVHPLPNAAAQSGQLTKAQSVRSPTPNPVYSNHCIVIDLTADDHDAEDDLPTIEELSKAAAYDRDSSQTNHAQPYPVTNTNLPLPIELRYMIWDLLLVRQLHIIREPAHSTRAAHVGSPRPSLALSICRESREFALGRLTQIPKYIWRTSDCYVYFNPKSDILLVDGAISHGCALLGAVLTKKAMDVMKNIPLDERWIFDFLMETRCRCRKDICLQIKPSRLLPYRCFEIWGGCAYK
jgi:hypothetical protein